MFKVWDHAPRKEEDAHSRVWASVSWMTVMAMSDVFPVPDCACAMVSRSASSHSSQFRANYKTSIAILLKVGWNYSKTGCKFCSATNSFIQAIWYRSGGHSNLRSVHSHVSEQLTMAGPDHL